MDPIQHNKVFLFIVIFVAVFLSCEDRRHYPQSLIVADSLADHNPDSAINYLNDLAPRMSGVSEADRMYYQLLCIKAADKAYIPHTSDSLIRPVLEYYEQGGDPQLLPIAYYYGGRVNMDLGDAPQAIDFFHKALDGMGNQTKYLNIKRFVYTQIGELFVKQSLFDEALMAYNSAYDCNVVLNDTIEMIFSLTDIASVYNFRDNRIEAINCLRKAYFLTETIGSNDALPNITNQLSRTYLHLHQPDSAHKYLQLALAHPSITTRDATYNIAVDVYRELGLQDSSLYFCQLLLKSDNIFNVRYSLQQLANYEACNHHTEASMSYYHQWAECNDSVEQLNALRQAAQMNAVYNYQLREKENQKLKYESKIHMGIIVASVIICLFLCLVILLLIKYQKKKNKFLSLKLEKYQRLVSEYNSKEQETDLSSLKSIKATGAYNN